jgi:glutaredoxin 3
MANITIYSTGTCVFCHAEKTFLDEKGVKYTDIRVDLDQKAAEDMMKLSGENAVPFTVVTDDDGKLIDQFLGFDQPRLVAAAGL